MKVINLSEHNSVLNHYLKEIRSISIQQDKMRFRRNIERIGEVMAIEVSKALDYAPEDVQTPQEWTQVNTISDGVVIGSVMRAGLPLHQGFLNMFVKLIDSNQSIKKGLKEIDIPLLNERIIKETIDSISISLDIDFKMIEKFILLRYNTIVFEINK